MIVASVSGSPYSEDHEWRRRQRYAILAGLEHQGFFPTDPDHLGFFWPRVLEPRARSPEVVPFEWFNTEDHKNSALLFWFDEDVLSSGTPLSGFDEFICRTLRAKVPQSFHWRKTLVLGPDTSTTLKAMANEVGGERRSKRHSDGCSDEERAEFYVSGATAADSELIPGGTEQDCPDTSDRLSEYFKDEDKNKNVTLYRMTATDAALACLVRDELILRQPRRGSELKRYLLPPSVTDLLSYMKGKMPDSLKRALGLIDDFDQNHVVLISEWDTFYGQSLPKAMRNCLDLTAAKCSRLDDKFIHQYSYLRGLDGQTLKLDEPSSGKADKASDKSKDANDDQDKASKEQSKTWPSNKPNDRAEGQGQFDYLRRMGEEIARFDARLRSGVDEKPENRSSNGIFAVGVLGSDRYDKLLILQALRPLLPNARFFTTDLDASALHPTALPFTRNLLIASSFALQLKEERQKEIPPFRSSYQTAAFFATQVAVKAAVEDPPKAIAKEQAKDVTGGVNRQSCIWKPPPPLLFEVGLSTLFELPSVENVPSAKNGRKSKLAERETDGPKPNETTCEPLGPGGIHPKVSDMFPRPGQGAPIALAMAIVGLGFGILLTCRFLRRQMWFALDGLLVQSNGGGALFARSLGVLFVVFLLVVVLAWAIVSWWSPIAELLTECRPADALAGGYQHMAHDRPAHFNIGILCGVAPPQPPIPQQRFQETRQQHEAERHLAAGKGGGGSDRRRCEIAMD